MSFTDAQINLCLFEDLDSASIGQALHSKIICTKNGKASESAPIRIVKRQKEGENISNDPPRADDNVHKRIVKRQEEKEISNDSSCKQKYSKQNIFLTICSMKHYLSQCACVCSFYNVYKSRGSHSFALQVIRIKSINTFIKCT